MSCKDEEADEELLSQLKLFDEMKQRSTFRYRFGRFWKSLKLRSALGHIGLMVSLSIYCVVGGVAQFILCIAHTIRALCSDCRFPMFVSGLLLINASIFFVLYINFYIQAYKKKHALEKNLTEFLK